MDWQYLIKNNRKRDYMNLTINIENINNIEEYIKLGINNFIFGLKDFNVNANVELNIREIKELLNKHKDINVFISIDKNIFNSELDTLKDNLMQLSNINIKAILFYDLSILNIVRNNNLNIDLVWNATHMVTNYNTCNYYYDKGVKYAYISSELTIDEIIEIKKNTSIEPLVFILGYPNLSHTRRNLLTNFYISNNIEVKVNEIKVTERDKSFIIKENYTGTSILGGNIVNGTKYLKELLDNNIKYLVLNDYKIDSAVFIKIINSINNYISTKDNKFLEEIDKLIGTNTHFFDKKTIYKVK